MAMRLLNRGLNDEGMGARSTTPGAGAVEDRAGAGSRARMLGLGRPPRSAATALTSPGMSASVPPPREGSTPGRRLGPGETFARRVASDPAGAGAGGAGRAHLPRAPHPSRPAVRPHAARLVHHGARRRASARSDARHAGP